MDHYDLVWIPKPRGLGRRARKRLYAQRKAFPRMFKVALHSEPPLKHGPQSRGEISYPGYERLRLTRGPLTWAQFRGPGALRINYASIGWRGRVVACGPLNASLTLYAHVSPQFRPGSLLFGRQRLPLV